MKTLLPFILVIAVAVAACNSPKPEPAPVFDVAKARTSIDSVNQAFMNAVAKGDSTTLASLYHSQGQAMQPNMEIVSGNAALVANFSGFIKMGITEIKLQTTELFGDEEHLIETGTYDLYAGANSVDKGKYVVVWKQEGGQWKLYRDIFNSNLPMPAPAPAKK